MHRDTTTARVAQPLTSSQQHQCTSAIHTCSVSSSSSESRTHTPYVRQAHACAWNYSHTRGLSCNGYPSLPCPHSSHICPHNGQEEHTRGTPLQLSSCLSASNRVHTFPASVRHMCTLLNSTRTPFRLVFIQQTARSPKLLWQGAADLQGPQDNRVHNLWATTSSDSTRSRSRSPGNHGQVLRLWGGRTKWDWRSRRAGLGFGEWARLLHCSSAGERERRCPSPFFTHLLLCIDPLPVS